MTADTGADGDDEAASDDSAESAADGGTVTDAEASASGTGGPDRGARSDDRRVEDLAEDLDAVRADVDAIGTRLDEKTVHRDEIRAELKRYVRKRQRRGHATGWGPYLVLLYGTAMTVAAFYYLSDWAAVAAMAVVWLSTLGLYVFMVVVGFGLGLVRAAGGLRDLVGKLR